jgi:hypothetical protein
LPGCLIDEEQLVVLPKDEGQVLLVSKVLLHLRLLSCNHVVLNGDRNQVLLDDPSVRAKQ